MLQCRQKKIKQKMLVLKYHILYESACPEMSRRGKSIETENK